MDFVTEFPRTSQGLDVVWVVVDRLTNLPIWITYPRDKLAQIYIRKIVWLHGVPRSIVSDRDHRLNPDFERVYPNLWALNYNQVQQHTPDKWIVGDYSNTGGYDKGFRIRF